MRRLLCGLIGLMFALPARAEQAVPRYQLKVGQVIGMRSNADYRYNDRGFGNETEWTIWVVRANPDGGWRVVVRSSDRSTSLVDGQQKAGSSGPDVTLVTIDLTPDGRIAHDDPSGSRLALSSIFPRLPRDAAELASGWQGKVPSQDGETVYRRLDTSTDKEFAFESETQGPMNRVYESTARNEFAFDRARGLVVRVRTRTTQDYGVHSKGTGSFELTSIEDQGPEKAAALADGAERYLELSKRREALVDEAIRDAKQTDALLARNKALLSGARDSFPPIFRDRIDAAIKEDERRTSSVHQQAKDRTAMIEQSVAPWKTTGLDGKPHALADYRGKIVILDFWNRGCGWCVMAMPQVKQLADDFRDRPVAILGMNTDADEADARVVLDAMSPNYPNLKAASIAEAYHVVAYPTFLILDRTGKIADVHIGYSPRLRDEMKARIESLLARP